MRAGWIKDNVHQRGDGPEYGIKKSEIRRRADILKNHLQSGCGRYSSAKGAETRNRPQSLYDATGIRADCGWKEVDPIAAL